MATIIGTTGPDVLTGTADHDTIEGLGGNDTITGLGGNDRLYGGDGDDLFLGATQAYSDIFFGGAGFDEIRWDGEVRFLSQQLADSFGVANSIEKISATTITGFAPGSFSLDFSRTILEGVALVRGDNESNGIAHNHITTSLSRLPGLVYDGGGGNDQVTVMLAPSDFVGSQAFPGQASQANLGRLQGLLRDINESRTADPDAGFTFDDSLGLTVQDFERGLKYGWFTLAGNVAEAALADVVFQAGTIEGTAANDILIGGAGLDTYRAGDGDDLLVQAGGIYDRMVTGAGDDTIVVVGSLGGRVNDSRDVGSTPDSGHDQMFVVGGTTYEVAGGMSGLELLSFEDAGGAGSLVSNGTGIDVDLTDTVLRGVNLVQGAGNIDTVVTALAHENVGGGLIRYDGAGGYDRITVNLGDFGQLAAGSGLRNDLIDLLRPATNVSTGTFTFDTAFDGFDMAVASFGDTRTNLDAMRVKLGYLGHDGALVTVAPTAANILIGDVPSKDLLSGTGGNDIFLRGANGETMNGGGGDDLFVGITGYGVAGRADMNGGEGSDTYLVDARGAVVSDDGTSGYDRVLAVEDGNVVLGTLLRGIEEIDANGHAVELHGSVTNDVMELADTRLVGIDTVRTFANADTIRASTQDHHVTYDGGASSDTMHFRLTAEQAGDADVQAEIAAFAAAGASNNNDWTFDELDFSIVSVETVVFDGPDLA